MRWREGVFAQGVWGDRPVPPVEGSGLRGEGVGAECRGEEVRVCRRTDGGGVGGSPVNAYSACVCVWEGV